MSELGWKTTKISVNYYTGLCLKPDVEEDENEDASTYSHPSGHPYDATVDFD